MELPSELFELIADFLPADDINSLAAVCKSAKSAFEDESLKRWPNFAVDYEEDAEYMAEEKLWFPNLNGDMEENDVSSDEDEM